MIGQLRLLSFFCLALVTTESYHYHKVTKECNGQDPLVTTSLGVIRGTTNTTRLGRTIYSFRGIRFAKPPTGDLRFQPPQPIGKWDGVFNATDDGPACPQPNWFDFPQSEDCLFVNVYSTELPQGHKNPRKPVLVFLHPGGYYFLSGASFLWGPRYLLDQGIVLVVPNYRLATLGFLSTGTKEAPGNNGLKDQVVLLQWVRDNIAAFGGDPNLVTIAGCSAGGINVNGHLVSPMSKGLFHRAIMMSGVLYSPWEVPSDQLELAKRQARFVNCPDQNVTELINCLKTVPATDLAESFPRFKEFGFEPGLLWRPVIERDFGQQRFLTEHPIDSVYRGRFQNVPVMLGVTAEEFAGSAFYMLENDTLSRELNEEFERVAPIFLLYERDTERSRIISRTLRKFYFGDGEITLRGLMNIISDGVVGFGTNKGAKGISEKSSQPVYYYCFNYTGRASYFYLPGSNNTVPLGAVHQDDLIYLFDSATFPYWNQTDPEYQVMRKMTTLWGNFIKTGNPTPVRKHELDNVNWEPFSKSNQKYLLMGSKLSLGEKLYEERYRVWEKLFPLPGH